MSFSNQEQKALIRQFPGDLCPDETSFISEEDLLRALEVKVAYMLQYNNGVFFQLLYKMDVLEPRLKIAMQEENVPLAIAKLILERQLEKLETRKANPPTTPDDKELEW